jgi:hypothetical protein
MSPEPILFNSWEQIRGGSAECQLRVGNLSAWSLPVSLETLGSTQSVEISEPVQDSRRARSYYLVAEVHGGQGRFAHTRVVTLVPAYTLFNNTARDLLIQQMGVNHVGELCSLRAGEQQPFHWPEQSSPQLLTLRFLDNTGIMWKWSQGFPIADVGTAYLAMQRSRPGEAALVRVDIRLVGAARQVVFSDSTETPPFRIENRSAVRVTYGQAHARKTYVVEPQSRVSYAWDDVREVRCFCSPAEAKGHERARGCLGTGGRCRPGFVSACGRRGPPCCCAWRAHRRPLPWPTNSSGFTKQSHCSALARTPGGGGTRRRWPR